MQILTNEQVIDNVIKLMTKWVSTSINASGKIGPLRVANKPEIEMQMMERLEMEFPELSFASVSDFDITESVILEGPDAPDNILLIHFERS